MRKQIYIKTYDTAGSFKGYFENFVFSSFTESLNGGLGDLTVTIPRKFDEYNSDSAVDLGYELKIYVADDDAPSGVQIGSFKIDEINTRASEEEEVTLNCSGYISELALDLVETSTPVAHTIQFKTDSQDLSQTIKDVIDLYRTNNPNAKINYSADSIETAGKVATVHVSINSPLELINHCLNQADSDWFWRVGADNILYFKQISGKADHLFQLGRDIVEISPERSLRDVRNNFLITNGLEINDPDVICKLYSDATSTTSYGRRFEKKRDSRYKATATGADEWGARSIALFKDPINKVTLRIADNSLSGSRINIEGINVGDTFKVINAESNDALTSNMLITSKTYGINYTDITADDTKTYVARENLDRRDENNLVAYGENNPTYYST